jgi:hypothetical protein
VTARGDLLHGLAEALSAVRAAVAQTSYPLPLPSAQAARAGAAALLRRLDDLVLPRLARLDAPLLVVVGGSTGAGKSTLVNSLVRAPVSPAGVVRPTTRAPVLVCHPADLPWFRGGRQLAGHASGTQPQMISAPALSPGLAYLDTPDLDSVVERHRVLADQLAAVADLWLFVTTAARYADAVPWRLLHQARERGTAVALVLDRVPPAAAAEVTGDVAGMLSARGPAGVPLFVLPETRVDGQGLLPERVTTPLRTWLGDLVADEQARAGVVGGTLRGALDALPAAVEELASAAEQQLAATETLAEQVGLAYGAARATVERGVRGGTLLSDDVLVRWRPSTGTAGRTGTARKLVHGLWGRVVAVTGGQGARALPDALEHGLVTLVRGALADAAEQAGSAWRVHPAGAELLAENPAAPSSGPDEQVRELARRWRDRVWELAGGQAATGALVMAGVLAAPPVGATAHVPLARSAMSGTAHPTVGGDRAGGDPDRPGAGPDRAAAVHRQLAAVLADPASRSLVGASRDDLLERIRQLLDAEAARWLGRLAGVPLGEDPPRRLRAALAELGAVRAGPPAGQAGPDPPPAPPGGAPSIPPPRERPAAGAPAGQPQEAP